MSLAVSACHGGPLAQQDWRAPFIADAEAQIRTLAGDPQARFSKVQLTGDEKTGQTCGYVTLADAPPRRFIVYIDKTAGPFVDADTNEGMHERLEGAWAADCIKEGYSAG